MCEQAERARQVSEKEAEPRTTRPSRQIYELTQQQTRAKWIADWVDQDWNSWYPLTPEEKDLWNQHNNGTIARRLDDLRKQQQQPRFPGYAEWFASGKC